MRILVFGHNRCGSTLVVKTIRELLNYHRFDPIILVQNMLPKEEQKSHFGYPSLDVATVSRLDNSNKDLIGYQTLFFKDYNLDKLPKDCVFRSHQIKKQSLDKIKKFDCVIHVTRKIESLLVSNVLDIPNAFEEMSLIDNPINRSELAMNALKETHWIKNIQSNFEKDALVFKEVRKMHDNFHTIDYEDLMQSPLEEMEKLLQSMKLSFEREILNEVLKLNINKPLGRWNSHFNDSDSTIREIVRDKIRNLIDQNKGDDKVNENFRNEDITISYKKAMYYSEFSIENKIYNEYSNQFYLKSNFTKDKLYKLSFQKIRDF